MKYKNKIFNEDCFDYFKKIPDKSIDMILCDLPYGMLADQEWDVIIPFDKLWEQYNRIIKNCGNIILFGSQPFTSKLINSNIENFKYEIIWEKNIFSNQQNCKIRILKKHENILIFNKKNNMHFSDIKKIKKCFDPLRKYFNEELLKTKLTKKEIGDKVLKNKMFSHYFDTNYNYSQWSIPSKENYLKLQQTGFFNKSFDELKKEYEELKKEYDELKKEYDNIVNITYNPQKDFHNGKYPTSVLKFNVQREGLHPTQKPVALCEYLIKTFSNDGQVVLDNCMGSGTTAIAAINTGRIYTGCELNKEFYDMAANRIKEHNKQRITTIG